MGKKIAGLVLGAMISVLASCGGGGDPKMEGCPAEECTSTCIQRCGGEGTVGSMACTVDGCSCVCR